MQEHFTVFTALEGFHFFQSTLRTTILEVFQNVFAWVKRIFQ